MPTAKYALKHAQDRKRFKDALAQLPDIDWTEKNEQYCDYRLDGKNGGGWLRAKQFSNGTLYLEASSDDLLEQMTGLLGSQVSVNQTKSALNSAAGSSEAAQAKLNLQTQTAKPKEKSSGLLNIHGDYIGTDESGKGDYFGPLVIAGVMVTEKTAAILSELGVMDSKKLSEAKIVSLAEQITQVVGHEAVNVVEIGPAKYNALYQRFKSNGKNLNHLLAWGHATVIENLLGLHPACRQAIADQFGDERYILSQLKEKGKAIQLHQTPRAEANVGVAAASIMARARFTQKIKQLSSRFKITLPLGASPAVKAAARQLIEQHGKDVLNDVAKLHFKTTEEVCTLP